MKTTIGYHAVTPGNPCPDGVAAAAVALQKYPGATLISLTYEDWRSVESASEFCYGDQIVLVDYSVPAAVIESWMSAGAIVEICDHHKTAAVDLSRWGKYSGIWFDMNECGATLAWKRYFPAEALPAWLRYVRDRDLWEKKLTHCDAIHLAAGVLGRSIEVARELMELSEAELLDRLLPIGQAALRERRDRVEALLGEVSWEFFYDWHVPIIRLKSPKDDGLVSDLGNAMCQKYPLAQFAALQRSDRRTWELRSIGDFDVSTVAHQLGGGGHKNAAGFPCGE